MVKDVKMPKAPIVLITCLNIKNQVGAWDGQLYGHIARMSLAKDFFFDWSDQNRLKTIPWLSKLNPDLVFAAFLLSSENKNEAGTKKSVFVQKLSFPSPPSWSGLIFSTGLICRLVWLLLTPTRWDAQDEFECPKVWKFENGDQRKSSYTKMLVLLLRFEPIF